ncbi:unnamed protein product [Cunninghamella blakesleeana]
MYNNYFTPLPLKGWLIMKKQSSVRKNWIQRYFVLESKELRCYKNENDVSAIFTYNLRHYKLEVQNNSTRQNVFKLVGQQNELLLQADNEKHFTQWVDTLELHVGEQNELLSEDPLYTYDTKSSTDVLDKWLEKYDLIVPTTDRHTPSLISLAPSSTFESNTNNDDEEDDDYPNINTPMTPHFDPSIIMDHPHDDIRPAPSHSKFFGFLLSISGNKRNKKNTPIDSRIHH